MHTTVASGAVIRGDEMILGQTCFMRNVYMTTADAPAFEKTPD